MRLVPVKCTGASPPSGVSTILSLAQGHPVGGQGFTTSSDYFRVALQYAALLPDLPVSTNTEHEPEDPEARSKFTFGPNLSYSRTRDLRAGRSGVRRPG